MNSKTKTVAASPTSDVERVMAQLIASRGQKSNVSISEFLADSAADAGRGVAKVAAGAAAGWENATLSFAGERDRQTRRTAEALLAAARA